MTRWTTVRYGHMRQRGLFTVDTPEELQAGDPCVVTSARGTEMGTILARPVEQKSGCGSGACGSCATSQGKVVRLATDEDRQEHDEVERAGTDSERRFARARIRELNLPMLVVDAEYLHQREKLIIHFTSEARVDFRDLVRDLAKEYKTRIELKQIGARDEARLVGDMASCGRELCCRTFLHDLQPVSMRMAKQQKKTLDPTKISGQCGKLKCCLRYEDEVYVELQKTLPRRNAWVRIEQGVGKVLTVDLLLQKLVIEVAGQREMVHVSALLETGLKPPRPGETVAPAARRAGEPAPPPGVKRVRPVQIPGLTRGPAPEAAPPCPDPAPAAPGPDPEPEPRSERPRESRAERPREERPERARPPRERGPSGRDRAEKDPGGGERRGRGRRGGDRSPSRESPARGRGERPRSGGGGSGGGSSRPTPPASPERSEDGSSRRRRRRRRDSDDRSGGR